jgi:hypothetical protein
MKKLIQAASLVTAGAAALTCSSLLAADGAGKPWTLGLALRGFYDDNIFTGNDKDPLNPRVQDSWGFEVTPSIRVNFPLDQTLITAGYSYGLRYFADRPGRDYDQYHLADISLSHTFSPRYKIDLFDSFAIAQEPEQIAPASIGGSTLGQVVRAQGNNLRNTAGVDFTAQLTTLWSLVAGYRNNYFDYDFEGFAGVLNRIEHLPSLNLRYQLSPKAVASLGYQYGIVDYDEANYRDNNSHYVFAGLDYSFTSQIVASIRAGAQFIEWDNAPAGVRDSAVSPYVDASISYLFAPGSSVQLGVRHGRNATDVDNALSALDSIYDQESTLVYGSVNYAITAKLRASLVAQYQNAEFIGVTEGGTLDGDGETFFSLGATINYSFTRWLSGELAYYYDRLSSDVDFRDYDRNRVFFGVRASY